MKKVIISALACCFLHTASAQKDTTKCIEVGMNATRILTQLTGNNGDYQNPYTFTLEGRYRKVGLRFGFGANSQSQTEEPGNDNGNAQFNRDTSRTHYRVGLVFYKDFSPKWSIKYGLDVASYTREESSKSIIPSSDGTAPTTTTIETVYGERSFNPFLFVQYHFSKHISIGTELYAAIGSYTNTEKTKVEGFAPVDREKVKNGNLFAVHAPTALFLIVRF